MSLLSAITSDDSWVVHQESVLSQLGNIDTNRRWFVLEQLVMYCELLAFEAEITLPDQNGLANIRLRWDGQRFVRRTCTMDEPAAVTEVLFWLYGIPFTIGDLCGYRQPIVRDARHIVWRKVLEAHAPGYHASTGEIYVTAAMEIPEGVVHVYAS